MLKVFKNNAALTSTKPSPVTLIVSFYMNTHMLDLVLTSVLNQTFKDFNLIICDDGSDSEKVDHVQNYLQNLNIPSQHLWHEDIGFRKNRILNSGLNAANSDYLIFIDQDCILHPEFVAEHINGKQKNSVLCGRRINLTSWVSQLLIPQKIATGFIEKNIWWIAIGGLFMKDNNGLKGFYFKNNLIRKFLNRKNRGIVGCNFSLFKHDLLAINGFDTRYEGAGFGEDSDIQHRLALRGLLFRPACNTAVQYHIYHRLLKRADKNEVLFNSVLKENEFQTKFGFSQQIEESSISS